MQSMRITHPARGSRAAGVALLLLALSLPACWARVPAAFEPPPPRLTLDTPANHDPRADLRTRDQITVLVFGDSGSGSKDQYEVGRRMAQACAARRCDLALMLGDNFYNNGVHPPRNGVWDKAFERKFEEPYAQLGDLQFWAVAGNHDWHGGRDSVDTEVAYSRHSARWRMPAYDYAVPDLPDWLHIYALDTVVLLADVDIGQRERARAALCGAPGWRIVMGHHPIYSTGPHAGPSGENADARDALLPLFTECGVDLYLAGHEHHQEHLQAGDLHQIVEGAAGKLRNVSKRVSITPSRQLFGASRFGFAILEISPQAIAVEFFGYPAGNPQAYGSIYRATIPARSPAAADRR
jgi:hypothetical protein